MMSCLVYSLELVVGYRRTDQDWKPLRDEIVNELDEKPTLLLARITSPFNNFHPRRIMPRLAVNSTVGNVSISFPSP
jgi:hypothetical protein